EFGSVTGSALDGVAGGVFDIVAGSAFEAVAGIGKPHKSVVGGTRQEYHYLGYTQYHITYSMEGNGELV
ncbi:hypothetical protein PPTG_24652, partial [Phytophthora nicotianae INRA-310]